MSTLGRTTRSTTSSNLGLGKNNVSNILGKHGLSNLAKGGNIGKNQLTNNQPLKRSALSSTTNLLLNKNGLNNKAAVGDLKGDSKVFTKQPAVKISTTENVIAEKSIVPSKISTTKGLGGVNRSRIPTKSAPKSESLIKSTITKQQSQPSQTIARVAKEINQIDTNSQRFSSFTIPANVDNIDQHDTNNTLLANDFSNDIYIYLRHLEESFKLKTDFLDVQQHMTPKMRSRLVDWIIAVHHKFKLLSETLYLTVAIMDRFLARVSVIKDKVQLVGLTSFFIACKYEEIYPPEIADFLKVCDAYSKTEILKMEKTILKTIDFQMSYPLPLHFLRRFSKAAYADQEIHTLAKYLMELSLLDYECASWKPSLVAAASLYLTLQILSNNEEASKWTKTIAFYTNYSEVELQPYVATLCKILILTKDSKLQTVYKKYSSIKMLNISSSFKLACDYVFKMSEKCI